MVKSMTAYGAAFLTSSLGKWVVEIHSVNKKALDIQIFAPKEFLRFDKDIRRILSLAIHRGQVTVKVFLQMEKSAENLIRLQSLKKDMEKVAKDLGFPLEQITLPFLYEMAQRTPLDIESAQEKIGEELQEVVREALKVFLQRREEEGKELEKAFIKHLSVMEDLLKQAETKALGQGEKYRKKILDRLREFKEVLPEDQERILREVFFYTEKVDVTEELVRLASHIKQFQALLRSEEKSMGRTMDFLLQEMGREINTLSSKSDDVELSKDTLSMKVELEKMKEQAQNVE